MNDAERKADTRRKIRMGGVVIAAKIDDLWSEGDAYTLLGAFLNLQQMRTADPSIVERWAAEGKAAMLRKDR